MTAGARPVVAAAVTFLFVPGDRPDRFGKAAAAGADVVIIDLEDAVIEGHKEEALHAAVRHLAPAADDQLRAMVRVNALGSAWSTVELEALQALVQQPAHGLTGVLVPKADDPQRVTELAASLAAAAATPVAVVALVESAGGVERVAELAGSPGVTRLGLGEIDLALDLGCGADAAAVAYARGRIVLACRAAGRPAPIASPSVEIRDLDAVAAAARLNRRDGFGGQLCIHPAQLDRVRAAFAPTAEEVGWAQSIVDVDADGGAAQVDGRMIDRPMVERARSILHHAT